MTKKTKAVIIIGTAVATLALVKIISNVKKTSTATIKEEEKKPDTDSACDYRQDDAELDEEPYFDRSVFV